MPDLPVTIGRTAFRIAVGVVLAAHGSQKLFGWFGGPGVTRFAEGMHELGFRPGRVHAVLAGLGEAGAGTALALGLGTPAAATGAAITMGVAAGVQSEHGFFDQDGGLEYPAVLGLAAAAFALGGAGPVSVDALTGRALDRPWMRATGLAVVPVAVGVQFLLRRRALAIDRAREDRPEPAAGRRTD